MARSTPGIRPHSAPASGAGQHHHGITTIAGVPAGRSGTRTTALGAPGAQQELALGADVPEAHPEGERAGEAGQDQRRRLDQRVADDAELAERGIEDVHVGPDRVAADERQDRRRR